MFIHIVIDKHESSYWDENQKLFHIRLTCFYHLELEDSWSDSKPSKIIIPREGPHFFSLPKIYVIIFARCPPDLFSPVADVTEVLTG